MSTQMFWHRSHELSLTTAKNYFFSKYYNPIDCKEIQGMNGRMDTHRVWPRRWPSVWSQHRPSRDQKTRHEAALRVICIPTDTESHLSRSIWVKSSLRWWGRGGSWFINSGFEAYRRSPSCISIHLLSADSSKPCLASQIHRKYNSQRCADYELPRQLPAQGSFRGRGHLWGSGSLWSTLQNSNVFSLLWIKHGARTWLGLGVKSIKSGVHTPRFELEQSFNSANPHFCHHWRGRGRTRPDLERRGKAMGTFSKRAVFIVLLRADFADGWRF